MAFMTQRRRPPLVLGHRGYRARFPENTLLAFREALGGGADGVECDLQKSADGRYVVIHDPTTERVTGASLGVAASRFVELRELDFGRGDDPYKRQWVGLRRQRIGLILANPFRPAGLRLVLTHLAGRARQKLRAGGGD